ncbi:MAG: type I-E CRISPR-associated protein Cse2/CasB [Lachnospiraceae bacterium]
MAAQTKVEEVREFVQKKIYKLLKSSNDGYSKAMLANMRRGVGKAPGDLPELWGMLFEDIPEELLGQDTAPSYAEWAIYTALTLFAVHQQGHDLHKSPMCVEKQTLGKALRDLVSPGDEDALRRIQRRFNAIATSSDMQEVSHHLRGAVQLLSTAGIALDYPKLAADLYRYQLPEGATDVRLSWGRDFYRRSKEEAEEREDDLNE